MLPGQRGSGDKGMGDSGTGNVCAKGESAVNKLRGVLNESVLEVMMTNGL